MRLCGPEDPARTQSLAWCRIPACPDFLYEDPEAVASEGEVITLYSDWFDCAMNSHPPVFPIREMGMTAWTPWFQSWARLAVGGSAWPAMRDWTSFYQVSITAWRWMENSVIAPHYHGREDSGTVWFYAVSAVYCSPGARRGKSCGRCIF